MARARAGQGMDGSWRFHTRGLALLVGRKWHAFQWYIGTVVGGMSRPFFPCFSSENDNVGGAEAAGKEKRNKHSGLICGPLTWCRSTWVGSLARSHPGVLWVQRSEMSSRIYKIDYSSSGLLPKHEVVRQCSELAVDFVIREQDSNGKHSELTPSNLLYQWISLYHLPGWYLRNF
jgi:hypothetical protein